MTDYLSAGVNLLRGFRVRQQNQGLGEAICYSTSKIYQHLHEIMFSPLYESENAYESEWDLLIILDGCRTDILREATNGTRFDFNGTVESRVSPSGLSAGWMRETFIEDYSDQISKTLYVTANPHTEFVFNDDNPIGKEDFGLLDEVWVDAWDEEIGTVPADAVTDRAISLIREENYERMIVHYMQPHFPSIPYRELGSNIWLNEIGDAWTDSVWKRLLRNKVSTDEVWEAYRGNLDYVLADVATLLRNVDAETAVISADHGNAFGECGFYGHGDYPIDCVRIVPWITTTASDTGEHSPDEHISSTETPDVNEKLQALGYIE